MRTRIVRVAAVLSIVAALDSSATELVIDKKTEATVECKASCTVLAIAFTQGSNIPGTQDTGAASLACTKKEKFPIALIQVRATSGGTYGTRDYVVLCK